MIENIKNTINALLAKWPINQNESTEEAQIRFNNDITPDFNRADFTNIAVGKFLLKPKVFIHNNVAKALVFDSMDEEQLNMITLVCDNENEWKLKSFKFRCLSCFGETIMGDEVCDTCGGVGWGLLD